MSDAFLNITALCSNFFTLVMGSILGLMVSNNFSGSSLAILMLISIKIISVLCIIMIFLLSSIIRFASDDPTQSKFIKWLFIKLEQVNERR